MQHLKDPEYINQFTDYSAVTYKSTTPTTISKDVQEMD